MKSDLYIYCVNTEMLSDEIQSNLLDRLPFAQKNKALGIKNRNKKKQFIVGRVLLIHALSAKYPDYTNVDIVEVLDQAPIVRGLDDVCLSISHSQNMVCCVIDSNPIGIDVEYKKDRQDLVEKSAFFMGSVELKTLTELMKQGCGKDFFYHIWCTKEAIFKTLDSSVQLQTSFNSIHLSDFFESGQWSLFQKEIDNYHLCLVHQDEERNVQCVLVELTNNVR